MTIRGGLNREAHYRPMKVSGNLFTSQIPVFQLHKLNCKLHGLLVERHVTVWHEIFFSKTRIFSQKNALKYLPELI